MTHDDGLGAIGLRERSDLHVALLSMRDGQHATVFGVEGAQAVRIVARVQAVDQSQIREVIDVGFDGEDDDHARKQQTAMLLMSLPVSFGVVWYTYTSLRSFTALTSLPKESSPMHFS